MRSRAVLTVEATAILVLVSAGVSLAHLWKAGFLTVDIAEVVLLVPAISGAFFVCVSIAAPSLYEVGSFSFPLPLTLPAIYTATLFGLQELLTRVGVGIAAVPDRLRPVLLWGNWLILLYCFLGAALCMAAIGVLGRESQKPV